MDLRNKCLVLSCLVLYLLIEEESGCTSVGEGADRRRGVPGARPAAGKLPRLLRTHRVFGPEDWVFGSGNRHRQFTVFLVRYNLAGN